MMHMLTANCLTTDNPLESPGLRSHASQDCERTLRKIHATLTRTASPPTSLVSLHSFILPCLWLLLSVGCQSKKPSSDQPPAPAQGSPAPEGSLYYGDITRQAQIDFVQSFGDGVLTNLVETVGSGAAFLDYNQDGLLDLYVVNGSYVEGLSTGDRPGGNPHNQLYRNRGNGTFEDVTNSADVADPDHYGMGVTVADYDNDGFPDIYVCNFGPNILYHNNGDGTFSDVSRKAGVDVDLCSVGAVWFDYDNDGLLDLYVGNYVEFDPEYNFYYAPDGFPGPLAYMGQPDVLFHNRGDGTFEDVTQSLGLYRPGGRMMGVSAADFDNDGFIDIYVTNDAMENYLFQNQGGQGFKDIALVAGVAYSEMGDATAAMAVHFVDYDNDGLLDIYVSDISFSSLFHNEGNGLFRDLAIQAGIAMISGQYVGWGSGFIDHDNDGDLDIFQVNGDLKHLYGQEDQLFDNLGGGEFRDASMDRGSYFQEEFIGRGACFGDIDNDGDIDAFIVNLNSPAILLENVGGNKNNWVNLHLVGTTSNRDGIGARVRVVSGNQAQVAHKTSSSGYLSQNDPRLHFGLGTADRADSIEIIWPSGKIQLLEDVQAGQFITVTEP